MAKSRTYEVTVTVQDADVDLLDKLPGVIRARFVGTAVDVIRVEPVASSDKGGKQCKGGHAPLWASL